MDYQHTVELKGYLRTRKRNHLNPAIWNDDKSSLLERYKIQPIQIIITILILKVLD